MSTDESKPRPYGFMRHYKPQKRTTVILDQVMDVLTEYDQYLPLTIRQIYYRLVGRFGYPKTKAKYETLQEKLNKARRAGIIPFDAIRDDRPVHLPPTCCYDGTSGFRQSVARMAKQLVLPRQDGQAKWLELWCEAAGMGPQLARVAHEYGVPVRTRGGYYSTTFNHNMALDILNNEREVEILYVGDYDPSGVSIENRARRDIGKFMCELGRCEYAAQLDDELLECEFPCPGCYAPVTLTRLAVTPEQVEMYGLVTGTPKVTDKRKFDFNDTFTCEAEALPPDLLGEIVTQAIESRQDANVRHAVLEREDEVREAAIAWAMRGGAA